MTLRQALKVYVKTLRELADMNAPNGPIDSQGAVILFAMACEKRSCADRIEALMREHR